MVVAALLVVIGLAAAAYVLLKDNSEETKTVVKTEQAPEVEPPGDYKVPEPLLPTIVFNDSGFSQPTYTFPAGIEVRVDNQSEMNLEFSSADHPTHKEHTEMNLDVLKPGESATFKPAGKGTYGFHDHLHAQYDGTLIIQ